MKEFNQLKNIDQKFYCSDYYDFSVNKYGVRVCGKKGCISEIDPYGCFQRYFNTGQVENQEIMKEKLIDGKEL